MSDRLYEKVREKFLIFVDSYRVTRACLQFLVRMVKISLILSATFEFHVQFLNKFKRLRDTREFTRLYRTIYIDNVKPDDSDGYISKYDLPIQYPSNNIKTSKVYIFFMLLFNRSWTFFFNYFLFYLVHVVEFCI
jgi:hypothetical protein